MDPGGSPRSILLREAWPGRPPAMRVVRVALIIWNMDFYLLFLRCISALPNSAQWAHTSDTTSNLEHGFLCYVAELHVSRDAAGTCRTKRERERETVWYVSH